MTRQEAVEKLLDIYAGYYNITKNETEDECFIARCDYFEDASRYVVSKKAELWHSKCEEFLYLFSVKHLDLYTFEKYKEFAYRDGMARLNIGPGHMYSFISPVFVCDTCDADAAKALKKCRIYKSFKFSLHGWMDFHLAAVLISKGTVIQNAAGRSTGKILKKVLFHIKKK